MHRQRHQKGSLQVRQHGKRKMWVLLYREGSSRKYATLGLYSKMTKSQAEAKRDEILSEVSARRASAPDPEITFGEFLEGVALPFLRSKWKRSTAETTENRIRYHLLSEFGDKRLRSLTLKQLQTFLHGKAETLSRSVVAHLRWDLRSIFKLAMAEGQAERDPTGALYTPKQARVSEARSMTKEEVEQYIGVFELRENVAALLAIFAGMRPGEILALQRRHVSEHGRLITIEQRLYRGGIDSPKTDSSSRDVVIPSFTAGRLWEWMRFVGPRPEDWVFASENRETPIWRDNLWYRHMKPKLEPIGLGWASFQVLRRTNASLGHDEGIDPKVAADQRGHGIGVSIDVYTKSGRKKRAEAAERLETAVLKGKKDPEAA